MPLSAPHPGLCAACRHARKIANDRDSEFWLCRRGLTEQAFPKYPPLPVTRCSGFEAEDRPPEQEQGKNATQEIEADE
jgi:hypothetical protein